MMNFQRDGQMQMEVPNGRANYEPNSLADHGEAGGPRECPATGFTSFEGRDANDEQGDKLRVRAELFADHYSQARLFWKSLTRKRTGAHRLVVHIRAVEGVARPGASTDGRKPAQRR